MREIKFRAKKRGANTWVSGYFYSNFYTSPLATHRIVDELGIEHDVDPATRGEFTGLKDKNSKEIHEGDILKLSDLGEFEVKWSDYCKFVMQKGKRSMDFPSNGDEIEIIGNIYENPELLGKGQND